jgi:hypothetical protein
MRVTAAEYRALTGAPAKKPNRPPTVRVEHSLALWLVVLRPKCRVVSEANRRDHWAEEARRKNAQKAAVQEAWLAAQVPVRFARQLVEPWALVVTLEHIGRQMDDDNLARAFKSVRDEVAALIGVDDGDVRVTWVYRQCTGAPGIVISIEPTGAA